MAAVTIIAATPRGVFSVAVMLDISSIQTAEHVQISTNVRFTMVVAKANASTTMADTPANAYQDNVFTQMA